MTPAELEKAIAYARQQIEICYEHGERKQAREWADELRDLIAERSRVNSEKL